MKRRIYLVLLPVTVLLLLLLLPPAMGNASTARPDQSSAEFCREGGRFPERSICLLTDYPPPHASQPRPDIAQISLTAKAVSFCHLEPFCRCAVYGLAVLFANRLYNRRTRVQTAVSAAAVLFPFAALGTVLPTPALPLSGMPPFSRAAEIHNIFCVFWILYTAFMAVRREKLQKELLQNQLRLQKNHYADLAGQMQEVRTIRHDIRHHFNQLGLLLKNGDDEGAISYLNRISGSSFDMVPLIFCENYTADVLLRCYYAKARKSDIPFEIRAKLPPQTGLPDEDVSVILGNVLENALEAGLRLPKEKRFLSLSVTLHSNNLIIESSNAFSGELRKNGGNYYSAKENGRYGIGISSIRSIARKYDGNVWIDTEERDGTAVFNIRILLITNM